MVNRISSKRKVKRNFDTSKCGCLQGPLGNVLKTSWKRPETLRLGRPLDVISGRPQDVRSGGPRDVRLGCPWDGQIGPLGDALETLEGDVLVTSWGPIFAGWGKSSLPRSENAWCVKNQTLTLLVGKLGNFRIEPELCRSKSNSVPFKR